MCTLTGASLICSCWMSVLTATKSTCEMPASIIRSTAFSPAPPTPTTRITARYAAASPVAARFRRAGCSGSGSIHVAGGRSRSIAGTGWDFGSCFGSGSDGAGTTGGAGAGVPAASASSSGLYSTVSSGGSARSPWRSFAFCAASVARNSSASGPSRMLARFRAIEHLLREVAVESSRLALRVVLQHRLALHRSLGVAHRLRDPRVEHEIAEVLAQDVDRLARVEGPFVEHRREDPLDLDVRV